MSVPYPFFIVDAFSKKISQDNSLAMGTGNPAAVCILDKPESNEWLQQVAAEFNLSETAFLWHQGENRWNLRWFTPTCEVKLCGHATLASAHVLARELKYDYREFLFSTLSGTLIAANNGNEITLDFPKIECEYLSKIYLHERGFDELNLQALDTYRAGDDILIHLATEAEVKNYLPDLEKIAQLSQRGLIITAVSDNRARDFVSRFFAPAAGIAEDPVTGSAHCSLAVFWSRQLGKYELKAEQLSRRGGWLTLKLKQDRVLLTGNSLTFAKGQLEASIIKNTQARHEKLKVIVPAHV